MIVRAGIRIALIAGALGAAAAPAGAADLANGRTLYGVHCAGCHGANGISVMPTTPSFARSEKLFQPDIALMTAIRNGRNAMPAYAGVLTDREIADVISYVRTLRP